MAILSSNPSSVVSAGTWTSAANVYTSNDVYATNTGATQNTEYPMEVGGFDFAAIPAGSTINSVTVTVESKTGTANRAQIKGELLDDTTVLGTRALANLTAADVAYTFTPTATLAQLQSANLKVRVTNKRIVSQASTTSVDWVKIDVDYTAPVAVLSQAAYRFYADGTESGSTALAAQDTPLAVDKSGGDVALQLRVRVQEGGGATVPATDDWQLQWEKNGSGWANVQPPSGSLADTCANITNQFLPTAAVLWAQSFLGDGKSLARAGFSLAKVGSPNPGQLRAELYAHTGTFGTSSGKPIGSPLATAINTVSITDLTTAKVWYYFQFDGSVVLQNGVPYCIAVGTDTAMADINNTWKPSNSTDGTAHPGSRAFSAPGSGVWTGSTASDVSFEVYTDALAEPVYPYATSNLDNNATTTNRLTGGSGSFEPGDITEDGVANDFGWTQGNYTEFLFSLKLIAADFTLARDTLRFRVIRNGAVLDTYAQVPTIIVTGATVLRDVFDNTPEETFTAYNDGQAGLWTGNQFYTYGAPAYTGWMIAGVRIYIPPNAPAGILTAGGKVSWAKADTGYWQFEQAPSVAINRLMEAGNQKAFSTLAPGWNDILFDTPVAWTHANGAFVGISWTTGGYYVHANPASPAAFPARDGTRLARSEHGTASGELIRGVNDAGGYNWSTAAYGLDIILAEPAAPAGPQTYQVSGTVAVTTAASGAPTRVPITLAVSGSVPVVTTASGAATVVGGAVTHQVSGTVAVSTAATGAVSARLPASGVVAVTTAVSGTADVSGMPPGWEGGAYPVMVRTTVSGNVTVVSGAVQYQVSGSVAVVTGTSGAATRVPVVHQVSGVVPVITVASGTVTAISGAVQQQVAGTVAVVTNAAGAATRVPLVLQVAGVASVATNASGVVSSLLPVSGTVPVLTAASGAVSRVPVTHQLSGTVAVVTTASGTIASQTNAISGTVAVVTSATGTLSKQSQVAGTVAVITSASGVATTRLPVSGVVAVTVNTAGTPTSKQGVSGTVNVVTSASGNALPPGGTSGTVVVAVGVSGAVTSRQGLAGTPVAVTTGVSGAVTSRQQVAGAVAVAVGVSGSVQINPRGRVDVVTGVSGAVTQVHQVSGIVAVVTSASGSIAGGSPVSGTVAVGTTVTGNVTVNRAVSGTVAVVTTATGAAAIAIRQFQVSGRVDVQTAASGVVKAAFWISGTVTVLTHVSGRATPPVAQEVPPYIPLIPSGPNLPLRGSMPALSLEAGGYSVTNDTTRLTLKGTR